MNNEKQKCDTCGKKLKYKEWYIACIVKGGGKLNRCIKCGENKEALNEEEVEMWIMLKHNTNIVIHTL